MQKIAFFDVKSYDRLWFDRLFDGYEVCYFESKLSVATARLASGCSGVCAFVNDSIDAETIDILHDLDVRILAMRSAGYSNVDFKTAYKKIHVVRVPAYSPYAVAEHAMALLLSVNRKTHRAYSRTRDFNFSIVGLTGVDLYQKTVGIIGTGKIGQVFAEICRGFGMKIIAYDLFPVKDNGIEYVSLERLLQESDIISLHCPLTESSYYLLNEAAFRKMKEGVIIINTSRGALIESRALLDALNQGCVRGAGLDVYEEEADIFFEDFSGTIIHDDTLALLVSRPNVLITSHQAFLTEEALYNIAEVTRENFDAFYSGASLKNEVCYQCGDDPKNCIKKTTGRCFL